MQTTRLARAVKSVTKRSFSSVPSSATVVKFQGFGDPKQVLKVSTEALPQKLGDQDVLLKMIAAPITPGDLALVHGNYPSKINLPQVGGNEGVASVVAVGNGVKNVKSNDTVVIANPGLGTWRNFGVFKSNDVVKVPTDIQPEYLSVLVGSVLTADRLVNSFVDLKNGDTLIQNGGNSLVGQAVSQIAKSRGVKTISVIRNRPDFDVVVERLKEQGAYIVASADYVRTPQFKRLIGDLPVPKLALNSTGGESATELARVLGNDGTLVTYGSMSWRPLSIPSSTLIYKNLSLRGFWISRWLSQTTPQDKQKAIDSLIPLIKSEKVKLFMETFKFSNFEGALDQHLVPMRDRKVVLKFD